VANLVPKIPGGALGPHVVEMEAVGILDPNGILCPFTFTPGGKLEVEAGLIVEDIRIGAVEIKDGDSDIRLDVELDVTKNAAFVQSESLAQEDTLQDILDEIKKIVIESAEVWYSYNENAAVLPNTETTLITYTVPVGKTARLKTVNTSGSASGLFRVKVNSSTMLTGRTSWNNRNWTVVLGTLQASAGNAITLTVIHNETINQKFEGSVGGELI